MTNAFDIMANHLRQLVGGLENGKAADGSPARDSPADLLAKDGAFAASWGDSPGRDLASHARMLVVSANDHTITLADSLQSTTAGINSSYTLARGLLEAAGRAAYLTEPQLDPRERIRRYVNERLWAIHENQQFLQGMGNDPAKLDPFKQKFLESAQIFNFHVVEATDRRPTYLDEQRPSNMKCINYAATSMGVGPRFGETGYRLLSAVALGNETGLVGTLVPTTPGAPTMTFGKSSDQLAKHFIVPLIVYASMADRFIDYYGWDAERWDAARQSALEFWVNHATPQLRMQDDRRPAAKGIVHPPNKCTAPVLQALVRPKSPGQGESAGCARLSLVGCRLRGPYAFVNAEAGNRNELGSS